MLYKLIEYELVLIKKSDKWVSRYLSCQLWKTDLLEIDNSNTGRRRKKRDLAKF